MAILATGWFRKISHFRSNLVSIDRFWHFYYAFVSKLYAERDMNITNRQSVRIVPKRTCKLPSNGNRIVLVFSKTKRCASTRMNERVINIPRPSSDDDVSRFDWVYHTMAKLGRWQWWSLLVHGHAHSPATTLVQYPHWSTVTNHTSPITCQVKRDILTPWILHEYTLHVTVDLARDRQSVVCHSGVSGRYIYRAGVWGGVGEHVVAPRHVWLCWLVSGHSSYNVASNLMLLLLA